MRAGGDLASIRIRRVICGYDQRAVLKMVDALLAAKTASSILRVHRRAV